MNGREVINLLKSAGWNHTSTSVHGGKDLGIGLLKAIEKQTGVKLLNRE